MKQTITLAEYSQELAAQWHPTKNGPLTPDQVSRGCNQKAWWVCPKCGHEWQAIINSRSSGAGCAICAQNCKSDICTEYWLIRNGSLAARDPELAAQWHPTKNGELTPDMVTRKKNIKVWWLGACGHEWQATIANRGTGTGCPICYRTHRSKRKENNHQQPAEQNSI